MTAVPATRPRPSVSFHRALPTLSLALSIVVLRLQVLNDLRIGLAEAWASALAAGIASDLMAALLPALVVAAARTAFRRGGAWTWSGVALGVWIATLANALYVRFFHMPLDWWVVRLHWRDLGDIAGSGVSLGASAFTAVSFSALVLALVAARWTPPAPQSRRHAAIVFAALLIGSTLLWKAPVAMSMEDGSPVVKDHILRFWATQIFWSDLYQGAGFAWTQELSAADASAGTSAPSRWLAAYRDHDDGAHPSVVQSYAAPYPLVHPLAVQADTLRGQREQLGLPSSGPVHIVFLVVESFRDYDFEDPRLGPAVFPHLSPLLARHALRFTQAYSSSQNAGQTARGMFSTLCSMLPNSAGPAAYLAFTTLRIECLPQVLKANGYRTVRMDPFRATFHQARLFEGLHGVDEFYDESYYGKHGVTDRIGDWGLADGPYLRASLDLLTRMAGDGPPVFATVATLSTHHPYATTPSDPLPKDVADATRSTPDYQHFLARFQYTEAALADFLEALFASPMGDRTLVVLLGDHGSGEWPTAPLNAVQRIDLRFRIMLALVTKHMPSPGRRTLVAHQVDVAPTAAAIAGVHGEVAWVGRNLLDGHGSPWVYASGAGDLYYRTPARYCEREHVGPLSCFNVEHDDPLMSPRLPPAPADADEAAFFEQVVRANLLALAGNTLMPLAHEVASAR